MMLPDQGAREIDPAWFEEGENIRVADAFVENVMLSARGETDETLQAFAETIDLKGVPASMVRRGQRYTHVVRHVRCVRSCQPLPSSSANVCCKSTKQVGRSRHWRSSNGSLGGALRLSADALVLDASECASDEELSYQFEAVTRGPMAEKDGRTRSARCWLREDRQGSACRRAEGRGHGRQPSIEHTGAEEMSATEQALLEKIRQLPPQRVAEVEDFVDFLRTREDEQRLTRAAARVSEASFAAVWNNDDDATYDRL